MRFLFFLPLLLLLFPAILLSGGEKFVLFLSGESNAGITKRAFRKLELPKHIRFRLIPDASDPALLREEIRKADLIIANGLIPEFRNALADSARLGKTPIYLLGSAHLANRIPSALQGKVHFPMEKLVEQYRSSHSAENYRNLVRYLVHKELDPTVEYAPPRILSPIGLADPATGRKFSSYEAYRAFRGERPVSGRVVITIYAANSAPEEIAVLKPLADALERRGLETAVAFGDERKLIQDFLLDRNGKSRFDFVIAFTFKFKAGLGEQLRKAMAKLDVPVVNALKLYRQTTPEWEKSVQGMNSFSVAFAMIAPEISGLIEPTLLYGRERRDGRIQEIPMPGNIERLADRAAKWIALRKKRNSEKRIALFFYHPEGGKQAIGASYLNVPRSIVRILGTLHENGYNSGGLEKLTEKTLTETLISGVRNVGSWAPGELETLLRAGEYAAVPFEQYKQWFAKLPEAFRESVIREWGPVEQSKIMTKDGNLIIPILKRGNLAILPEPMRGYAGDVQRILHSGTLPPPHQYVAVYLYLRHEFKADAVIHLGRHGSLEWLPGKQLGLSDSCAPALLGGDIPCLYPYISDGIGEGILAKRRGGAVILSHLTPLLGAPGEDAKVRKIRSLISEWQSADPNRKADLWKELKREAEKTSLLSSAGIPNLTEESLDSFQHFLEDLAQSVLPFGLHSFGISPEKKEIAKMVELAARNGGASFDRSNFKRLLESAGRAELDALLAGLDGRFVAPGPSGDPVRSPDSLPTGRNFYGFDPDKFPTRSAFENGRLAAEKIIADHRAKHNGEYPQQTAIVLWAGESIRTGGLNESIFLHLIGMEVEWDANGRVRSFKPIPAARLGRPRLDVMATASGAYRDQFAGLMEKLDRAQREAARLTDTENFIAQHNQSIMKRLAEQGIPESQRARLAERRVYAPAPGTYGTGVNRLTGSSGAWEKNSEIAGLYRERMSYGMDPDGSFAKSAEGFRLHLANTSVVLHSRSSTLYGVTDIDDMYQYLGGLSLAVKEAGGQAPREFIIDNRNAGRIRVSPLKQFLAAELSSRALHRDWIAAQQKENYAGARMIARTVDNLWGWQSVTPENVAGEQWNELYEVYFKDRHQLGLSRFFRRENAWAEQSIAARMLEAVRKNFWNAPETIKTDLARSYAQSVIDNGVACCDHTCNNPLLHQMVVNLISVPGAMSPEKVAAFQLAVERAAGQTLADQLRERSIRHTGLESLPPERESATRKAPELQVVKGYKMERKTDEKNRMSSSGIRWLSLFFLLLLIGLFLAGTRQSDD